MKLDVPMECCDQIVVAKLKADIKTVRFQLKVSTNPTDISDHKKDVKAMRRVLGYYGG